MSDRPRTRLHLDDTLATGARIRLTADRAHLLRNVLRLEPGALVAAFNGRDGEWLARIGSLGKASGEVEIIACRRLPSPLPDVWLLFAPIKRGRIDSVAEKATELGVSVLQPVFTRRTDPDRVNTDRLRANAVEAAEQCERLSVPEVREPQPLGRLLADWPADRVLYVCAETGAAVPLADAARANAGRPAAFLIGPEGGFDDSELDELRRRDFAVAVGLGPRVLRADTAAVAALACWQALSGDWRQDDGDHRPPRAS